MRDIFKEVLGDTSDVVTELIDVPKPSILEFKYQYQGIEMLNKHIKNKSKICLLADVDMDGIGSAYVVYHFLTALGLSSCIKPIINKERVHGISLKHIDYINKLRPDLFIIVDSSSNELDIIKEFNCDVLVIDHHNIPVDLEGFGKTSSGFYCIISNILSKLSSDMSGCQVVYEFFRIYEKFIGLNSSILETQLLYQIVGITLFSDAVHLNNLRNQWYIQNTLCNFNINSTLKIIMSKLNIYEKYLTKSFIQFKLVPLFNKAIRAGKSSLTLDIFINNPDNCTSLLDYSNIQKQIVDNNFSNYQIVDNITFSNLDNTDTSGNYSGILAQHFVNETHKTSIAFKRVDGVYKGSFRGLCSNLNYRESVENKGIKAMGHNSAFGIEFTYDKLDILKSTVHELEKEYKPSYFIGIACDGGMYRLNSFKELVLNRGLLRLSYANKNLASSEQLIVKLNSSSLVNTYKSDKYSLYKLDDFEVISFEKELTDYVYLYIEYTDGIKLFIRNIN